MKEPRKIVLILGNGFDLDLGLKTSYKDFWESDYCPKDYPAPLIHHLNQRWPDNLDAVRWYDLENELLNYYKSIPDPEEGADILTTEEKEFLKDFTAYGWLCGWYNDRIELVQSLVDKGVLLYRKKLRPTIEEHYKEDALQSPIWRDRKALTLIKDGLCRYLNSIVGKSFTRDSLALNVLFAAECSRKNEDFLSIYDFNYTQLPVDYGNGFHNIVHYVHGNCANNRIIIGTRDDGEYDRNYDFLQKSFDPNYNPPSLVADLLEADEVIIFGHSIGQNDQQYFKTFFKQRTDHTIHKQTDITIFTRDHSSEVDIKRSLQRMTDNNLSTLYGMNHVKIIKTMNVQDDPAPLRDFFSKHITDQTQLMVTMNKFL